MQQDKLIPLCKLYRNVSKTSGREYFVGNLSMTTKLLIFENQDAQEGEPGWTVFLAERQPKPQAGQAQDPGGLAAGDYPARGRR
jgi:hypothetical protein